MPNLLFVAFPPRVDTPRQDYFHDDPPMSVSFNATNHCANTYQTATQTTILTPNGYPSNTIGDIDISKAQRPRSPADVAPAPPTTASSVITETSSGTASPAAPPAPAAGLAVVSASGTDKSDRALVDGGGAGRGGGASGDNSQISAVTVAWEAFKAHSAGADGGSGNVGDALTKTIKAAAAATSLAVEHLRKRSRHRLLLEKGISGSGRRLSGPLQITLEDLKVAVCCSCLGFCLFMCRVGS